MALSLFSDTHWNLVTRLTRLLRGALLFPWSYIDGHVEIWDKKNKKIWKWTWIRKWVVIQDGILKVWKNTNIWPYSTIFPWKKIVIWNNVLIWPHVWIYWWSYDFKSKESIIKQQWTSSRWIIIEDDVWIGSHSVITDWVTIKKGSVVWSWSIVTKDTQPYSISVWSPAKNIWYRK